MESALFLSIAQATGCKSVTGKAARKIRKYAIRKNEPLRRDSTSTQHKEDEEVDDKNLLPTTASLRTALSSTSDILELVECRCSALYGLQWQTITPPQDSRFASVIEASLGKDKALISVANLILSGCTFALRTYFNSGRDKLDDFLTLVNRNGGSGTGNGGSVCLAGQNELQLELFDKLCADPAWADKTLGSLAENFASSVTAKSWLFEIPSMRVTESLQSYSEFGRRNMPFIEKSSRRLGHRRYVRFRVADDYAESPELKECELWRKEVRFPRSPNDRGMLQEMRKEVKMLRFVNGLEHEHIARMLFAFEEQDSEKQYVSIVFHHREYDLGSILHSTTDSTSAPLRKLVVQRGSDCPEGGILTRILWRAMLGICDAVDRLHRVFKHPEIRADGPVVTYTGHFDIKPGNIVVEIGPSDKIKLLLTDFGRSQYHEHAIDETSGQPGEPATPSYAPPETDESVLYARIRAETPAKEEVVMLRPTYDIWSLGCVLLEVLTFLVSGDSERFLQDRMSDGPESPQNAAFWCLDSKGEPGLRSSVVSRLRHLIRNEDASVSRAAKCIEHMLEVKELDRRKWRVHKCVEHFQQVEDAELRATQTTARWTDMVPLGKRVLMDPELANMNTLCWRSSFSHAEACSMYCLRNVVPDDQDEILLVVKRQEMPWPDTKAISHECFVPVFVYTTALSNTEPSQQLWQCGFSRLHPGLVFHFGSQEEYHRFFTLMTYQHVLRRHEYKDFVINFSRCEVKIHRSIFRSDNVVQYRRGCLQVWNTCDEPEYNKYFDDRSAGQTEQSSRTDVSINGRDASLNIDRTQPYTTDFMNSRFKLAIFTSREDSEAHNNRVAIILELDRANIQRTRSDHAERVIFVAGTGRKHSYFPAAIREPDVSIGLEGGQTLLLPSIPMSPGRLKQSIRGDSGTRLSRLTIDFPNADSLALFNGILESWKIMRR